MKKLLLALLLFTLALPVSALAGLDPVVVYWDTAQGKILRSRMPADADYWQLIPAFAVQATQSYCSVASAVTVLNAMPIDEKVTAQRVLEINASHPVFKKLCDLYTNDKDTLKQYSSMLYTQALLIEGVNIEDPVGFSNQICDLMTK